MTDPISDAIELAGVDPIAAVVMGSALYNTQVTFHDYDVAVFVPTGKIFQKMQGVIDVKVISLESLLRMGTRSYLYETEAALGLLYGHGVWYDHPWKQALRMYRPSIWAYAETTRRFRMKEPDAIKHIARHDIYLRRFWESGNADPRLSDDEREEWYGQVFGGTGE